MLNYRCLFFSHSVMSDSATPWTGAGHAPLFMEFSRQEHWSSSPFPLQGIFLTQRSNPCLLSLQLGSLPLNSSSIQWSRRQALQKRDITKYTGGKVVQYTMANRKIKSKLHNSKLNIWIFIWIWMQSSKE